jgi:hypothetical protein
MYCLVDILGISVQGTGLVPQIYGSRKPPYFQDHDVEEAKALFKKGLTEEGVGVTSSRKYR